MLVFVALALSAALLSHAQSSATNTNNTQLDIEAIEAHFVNAGLVPSLLKQFNPSALMVVNFSGVGQIQPGQNLTVNQVKPLPNVSVIPANTSVSLSGNYTLTMVDADVVGTDETKGQTRHWLVNSITTSGNALSMDHAINITDYASPLPPQGTGAHRYVVILYNQPANFSPPGNLAQPNQPVGTFDLNQYVTSSNLGTVAAATYFDVQQGAAPASVSATSPVVTSTLPAATSTGTSSSSTPSATSGRNSASVSYNLNTGFAGLLAFVGIILAA